MNKYLKSFRLLKDGTIIELFDLSTDQISDELMGRIRKSIMGYECWEGADGTILIQFPENGIIYPTGEKFQKMLEVGIQSDRVYFSFCPSADEFLAARNNHIKDLTNNLLLDEKRLDNSEQSLIYIENVMHSKQFKTRQQVERLFLGILSYCGESLCKEMNGEWYVDKKSGNQFDSGWEPLIKLQSGRILDPFPYLHEGLFLYGDDCFLPMIDLRPTNEFKSKATRNQFYTFYSES